MTAAFEMSAKLMFSSFKLAPEDLFSCYSICGVRKAATDRLESPLNCSVARQPSTVACDHPSQWISLMKDKALCQSIYTPCAIVRVIVTAFSLRRKYNCNPVPLTQTEIQL